MQWVDNGQHQPSTSSISLTGSYGLGKQPRSVCFQPPGISRPGHSDRWPTTTMVCDPHLTASINRVTTAEPMIKADSLDKSPRTISPSGRAWALAGSMDKTSDDRLAPAWTSVRSSAPSSYGGCWERPKDICLMNA